MAHDQAEEKILAKDIHQTNQFHQHAKQWSSERPQEPLISFFSFRLDLLEVIMCCLGCLLEQYIEV